MTLFDQTLNIDCVNEKIYENKVYTASEAQEFLRVSESTIKRFLKKKLIRANKVGGQYRILGKELLRLVSPELEKEAVRSYLSVKKKINKVLS